MRLKYNFAGMFAVAAVAVFTGISSPALADFDVAVEQTSTPSTINVGETVTRTVTFTNHGPDLSPVLYCRASGDSTQWELISFSNGVFETEPDQPYYNVVLANFQLAAGETTSTEMILRAKKGGVFTSYADIYYDQLIPAQEANFTNNISQVKTVVLGDVPIYDLAVSYHSSTANVQAGGLLALDLAVKNNGPDGCSSLTLSIMKDPFFHSGMRFGDMTLLTVQEANSWDFRDESNSLIGSLPFLAAGDSTTVTLLFRILDGPINDRVINSCGVSSSVGADLDDSNNTKLILIPLTKTDDNSGTDMEIGQSVPTEVAVDKPFTLSYQATNRGPNPTANAYIGNLVPDNLRIVAVSADRGMASVTGKFVKLEGAQLSVGEAATLQVTVVPNTVGEVAFVSGVVSDGFDPNLANNVAGSNTIISPDGPNVTEPQPCVDTPDLITRLTQVKRRGKFNKKQGQWQYKIQAKVEVENIGTACSTKAPMWFYLSNNVWLDAADILIGGKNVGKVCPGKKPKKVSFKTKLPMGLDPDNYYVLAVADGENLVPECDETNNMGLNY